jgi:hypothetical protein
MARWSIEVSRRYAVIGVYRDRDRDIWRIYPLPFVRLSVARWSCRI